MDALLLSDAIRRVKTIRELQNLINTRRVKSRLLELSDNHLNSYYASLSGSIVKQFIEYITNYPYDRNLKLEFIDVINVLNPESVTYEWDTKFSTFLAEAYLNGDVTMDWIVNLINTGGDYKEDFFVQVMNDDNEQEVYNGLMRVTDKHFVSSDKIISKVGSRHILEQYINTRGIYRIGHLLSLALTTSMGRFRLILSILLENGYSCKEVLLKHLEGFHPIGQDIHGPYSTVISILASDCSINLADLRDELPLGSGERMRLERIINQGDV